MTPRQQPAREVLQGEHCANRLTCACANRLTHACATLLAAGSRRSSSRSHTTIEGDYTPLNAYRQVSIRCR
eukprot:scaffold111125_cov69-Phaeocystis_antarctica.AAC.4